MLIRTSFMQNLPYLMKFDKALIAICIFFILSFYLFPTDFVIAANTAVLTEIDIQEGGFRDLRWGRYMIYKTHVQTSGGNVNIYKRDKDKLILDNKINLSQIEYGFLNTRLLFVALTMTGRDNREVLK